MAEIVIILVWLTDEPNHRGSSIIEKRNVTHYTLFHNFQGQPSIVYLRAPKFKLNVSSCNSYSSHTDWLRKFNILPLDGICAFILSILLPFGWWLNYVLAHNCAQWCSKKHTQNCTNNETSELEKGRMHDHGGWGR